MNSEKAAQLKTHLDAIAQLLYEESDPENMKTLEGIEMTVRQQIGVFCISPEKVQSRNLTRSYLI